MTELTINTLSKDYPSLEESTQIDFNKTIDYLSSYTSLDVDIVKNNCPSQYQASNLLLRKAQLLYRNNDVAWLEAIAAFEELHAECLLKDNKNAISIFSAALDIYRWMSEGSDYLQSVYKEEADRKREDLFRRMDCLQWKIEACKCIAEQNTEPQLTSVLRRLRASRSLWHAEKEIKQILYLLSYDSTILSNALPLVINLIHELIANKLMDRNELTELFDILKRKVQAVEDKVAEVWYMDDWDIVHPVITNAIQVHSLLYLVSKEVEGASTDQAVIAARICRYLSRIPSVYADVLKNKSYTLLTGENRLNGRINWERLCNFDERNFLEQLVTIEIEDPAGNVFEQVSKWRQYSNALNTLTLDNDGFTLSKLLPHTAHTWKGRKDRVSVLNNRLFVALFAKPVCSFDSCKTIKDYRLYWKQLADDFSISLHESKPACKLLPQQDFIDMMRNAVPEVSENKYPSPDEQVSIRIVSIDKESQSIYAEIINEAYQGIKARLPFAYINSSYSMIPGFSDMFSVNQLFKVRVKEVDRGEIVLSLIQDFNEFVYPECVRRKSLLGKVVEVRDKKVWWLLSSGVTATTNQTSHKKYRIGDIFKVEYEGLLSRKLKNNINVRSHVAHPDEEAFMQSVQENIQDFFIFLTKDVYKGNDDSEILTELKKENNPFFVALKDLSLDNNDIQLQDADGVSEETEESVEKDTKNNLSDNSDLTIEVVRELIYCVDALALDLEDSIERFNVYNILGFLCNLTGNQSLANYYQLCADYIYNVEVLMTEPYHNRFSEPNIQKFRDLLKRMEVINIDRYGRNLKQCRQVISVLQTLYEEDSLSLLNTFIQDKNPIVSELARYFSIIRLLREKDTELQEVIYKSINLLLGFKETSKKKKTYIPVYFGHEGMEKEFKTSAFIHADKNAGEEQYVVLARVIASFMNTDGGTLYIGVNDQGYLVGLEQELKHARNDSDVYLRVVNRNIISQLGDKESRNRYQENIRCRLYEYEDGRMVLAFRVSPVNEVVKVKGVVYTRTGSSSMAKEVSNVDEFVKLRRSLKLDSTPKKPEFPLFYSEERKEYIFKVQEDNVFQLLEEGQTVGDMIWGSVANLMEEMAHEEDKKRERIREKNRAKGKAYVCTTSNTRTNPLLKKPEHGYTPGHLFVSLFANGKIAASPSPKIGVWGDDGGRVVFSYNPDDKEDLLVTVYTNGEVGLSNMKKGISQTNTPLAFLDSVDNLLFMSPARKTDYLLLISEKEDEKRFRIITLDDFEKSMSIQPRNTLVLEPDKGVFIYAEILSAGLVKSLSEDKLSLKEFDQYNGGRRWEHISYKSDVTIICKACGINF